MIQLIADETEDIFAMNLETGDVGLKTSLANFAGKTFQVTKEFKPKHGSSVGKGVTTFNLRVRFSLGSTRLSIF